MRAALVLMLRVLVWPALVQAHEESAHAQRLPLLGAAPEFALTSQDGVEVTLDELRGKVVAVTFIYTRCPDVCPMLTDTMARVQDALGPLFGRDVAFVSISIDPERDTPAVLKEYAEGFEADLRGWSFLTGDVAEVREVALDFGVVTLPATDPAIDHNALTTLIDRDGVMRVQYIGSRFDPEEFEHDLRGLADEP